MQLLVASCIKKMMGLENVGWFQDKALWIRAISSRQGIGFYFPVSREVDQGKVEPGEE